MAEISATLKELGLDGLEIIFDYKPYTEEMPPADMPLGLHLMFFSHWVDFWRGNHDALMREYGSDELVRAYYRCDEPSGIVSEFRQGLQQAKELGAEYVVFHVSDVGLEECFTYQFAHSDEEVIDASIELINRITDGMDLECAFLVENQWWPGLTFTRPEMTQRLLEGIEYENKGVMLDIGHLMSTNTSLRTQAEAAEYVHQMLDEHGELSKAVRGLHLHQSLSGEYVEANGYRVSDGYLAAKDYWEKYARCYDHVLQIDRHQPWDDPIVGSIIERINPEWINHELSAWGREAHSEAVRTQMTALRG